MSPLPLDPILAHGLAAALATILLIGAVQKLMTVGTFTETLAQYQVLPDSLLPLVAHAFPLAELLAGLLLLMPEARPAGVLMGLLVIGAATAAVAINVQRGRTHLDCGCGMGSHTPLGWALVGRNALLMALLTPCLLPVAQRELGWLDVFAAFAAILFVLGTYLAVNTLLANAPRLAHLRSKL